MTRSLDAQLAEVVRRNADAGVACLERHALQQQLLTPGADWAALLQGHCPHLFSSVAVFVTQAQWQQMQAIVAAAEHALNPEPGLGAQGVFFGYDFHLNADGAHLIEINTNAGGGWLAALLADSQRGVSLPGAPLGSLKQMADWLDMFQQEWQAERGDVLLRQVAIVDEAPAGQYLYPEFLLAQVTWQAAGVTAHICAPQDLQVTPDGVAVAGQKLDLIYNRLTDFDLTAYPALRHAAELGQVLLTPAPAAYARYADKRHLVTLSQSADADLQDGVPETRLVQSEDADFWWENRRQWFFKPLQGYGSKGAYRGDKITKRVFGDILQGGYIAQRLAPPGERAVALGDAVQTLKFDVRCYVYRGQIQHVVARLYQGQTTNFRTPGGGFALVRLLD